MYLRTAAIILLTVSSFASGKTKYRDNRPEATMRLEAKDHGIVLRHGDGPEQCDIYGARDAWVYKVKDT